VSDAPHRALLGDFISLQSETAPGPAPGRKPPPIGVSLTSPDSIACANVPPLFVRTLLLCRRHRLLLVTGIPPPPPTCATTPPPRCAPTGRAAAPRAARRQSPSSCQAPFFLVAHKAARRKLQETAITFLLESALGKDVSRDNLNS